MPLFILYLWIITLIAGAYLWTYTTGIGRPESVARATRLPVWILFVHPSLALAGFGIWAVYFAQGGAWLVWAAFVDLLLVAVLGDVMAIRTHRGRREQRATTGAHVAAGATAGAGAAAGTAHGLPSPDRRRVEDQIPTVAILVHGVLALGLLAAVLVEAITETW